MRRLVLFFLCAASLAAATATKTHLQFRAEAEAALVSKDYAAARTAYTRALALRPDSPRYLRNLAVACALDAHKDEALDALLRLAGLGIVVRVETDAAFASLQGTPEFTAILEKLAANGAPRGKVDAFAELPSQAGIIEGIAFRESTGDLFLGDVHLRCIWRRDRAGQLTRFTAEDAELLGVFGLALDEKHGALWAATSALPEMSGFTPALKGRAGLAEFDLASGKLRRVRAVPADGRDHVLGDLLIAPDDTIYLTDSAAPIIWELEPGNTQLTKLLESPNFISLQGLAIVGRSLLVSDYSNGLFAINPGSLEVRAIAPPPNTTLLGLDGFISVPGGIIAVQNGIAPQRLVRISLSPDLATVRKFEVLAAALPGLDDLTLVTMAHGRPTFVSASGWEGFAPAKSAHPSAHAVKIFQLAAP